MGSEVLANYRNGTRYFFKRVDGGEFLTYHFSKTTTREDEDFIYEE